MLKRVADAVEIFREKVEEVRAEQKGVALSRARMLHQAAHVPMLAERLRPGRPAPIEGANIRMRDGKVMTFHTDGSLRHRFGHKPGKAARKALKRQRQAQARAARRP